MSLPFTAGSWRTSDMPGGSENEASEWDNDWLLTLYSDLGEAGDGISREVPQGVLSVCEHPRLQLFLL